MNTGLSPDEFAALMARFAPFEDAPRVAVGVSGGRDSLALVLLADSWARARGGAAVAITVDHGLRPESAAEARKVGEWMHARDIAHVTLTATGLDPDRGVEAAARTARYRLLDDWCRENHVLHLLIAHHRGDQDETRHMRLARASGPAGRAGMAAVREMSSARVLRPLLDIPRARLEATLRAHAHPWIDDPSNFDLRFERARMRMGEDRPKLPDPRAAAADRVRHDNAIAAMAARCVSVFPAGFATVDATQLCAGNPDVASGLLSRVVTCIAGTSYPPRGERLSALWQRVQEETGLWKQTLGGCIVARDQTGRIVVYREQAAVSGPAHVTGGGFMWDGRFLIVRAAAPDAGTVKGVFVGALGDAARKEMLARGVDTRVVNLPHGIRSSLPGLFAQGGLVCGPDFAGEGPLQVRFAPRNPVAGAHFGGC